MARYPATSLETISDTALVAALARTPLDQYVIWNGVPFRSEPGSIPDRVFKLIPEAWEPAPLRTILTLAARLSGAEGLKPERVRSAFRVHQSSGSTCYFLVRRDMSGDYLAVTDVPCPSSGRRMAMGDVVLRCRSQPTLRMPARTMSRRAGAD